jgi:hypothetical protein
LPVSTSLCMAVEMAHDSRCLLAPDLLTMLLLFGCSAGGWTFPNRQQADVFACMQD